MSAVPESQDVTVLSDADELVGQVARRLLALVTAAQVEGGTPSVVLTGGSIADAVHREVARLNPNAKVDWSRVELWWGDERFVPADSPERNARQAREALLDHVSVDPALVHEMPAAGTLDVATAAAAYGEEVRARGDRPFDLVMLGLGPDGHVASLFPGRPELDVDDTVAVPVAESPKPPPERISLTYPVLNRARETWFVVSGSEKADAAARALGGADRHEIPAAGIQAQGVTRWFLDTEAAGAL